MTKKFRLLLTALFLTCSAASVSAQTGSVRGVITDSLTGQPVAGFTVFIPSTTFGTTTGPKGEYRLDKLNPGDYKIEFRHLAYRSVTREITVLSDKPIIINLTLPEQPRSLREFVIVGKTPDPELGFLLFKEHFLGDKTGHFCTLTNPRDLSYFYDGDLIKAMTKKPLIIVNRHLGYRVTYFLDYFKYVEDKNPDPDNTIGAYFGYAGSAVFEDLSAVMPVNALGFKMNRSGEFRGSLRHFLACLYQDELKANHYLVRKAYHGIRDLQYTEKLSNAMAKIRIAQMDSLFSWDPVSGIKEFLYFDPNEEFALSQGSVKPGTNPGEKIIATNTFMLVFSNYLHTDDMLDDWISSFRLSPDGMTFDRDGNYWVPGAAFSWTNLHNTIQVKTMLPYDFMPKIAVSKGAK